MILRLSQKLAKKIHETELQSVPMHENPYLDWHADLFRFNRSQYILVSNSKSLLSVFIHGGAVRDFNHFMCSWLAQLKMFLQEKNADMIYEKVIIPNSGSITLAKSEDRHVIGSINSIIQEAKYFLEDEEVSPFTLSFRINDSIYSHTKYMKPEELFLEMGLNK